MCSICNYSWYLEIKFQNPLCKQILKEKLSIKPEQCYIILSKTGEKKKESNDEYVPIFERFHVFD